MSEQDKIYNEVSDKVIVAIDEMVRFYKKDKNELGVLQTLAFHVNSAIDGLMSDKLPENRHELFEHYKAIFIKNLESDSENMQPVLDNETTALPN